MIMEINNISEMIANLKLRQSETMKDNQSQTDSSFEQSNIDLNSSLDIINNDDINLDPITNNEIISVSHNYNNIITDDQSKSEIIQYSSFLSLEPLDSEISVAQLIQENNIVGKFNKQGQDAILQAEANGTLAEFAATLPPPRERAKILKEDAKANNTDTWTRYVYRTAFKIPNNKTLGSEFYTFKERVNLLQKKVYNMFNKLVYLYLKILQ